MNHARTAAILAVTAAWLAGGHGLWAGPILDPTAPNTLVLYTLGSVPGIAAQYGNDITYQGIAITANNLLLAVGNAGSLVQTIWSVPVVRSSTGHITSTGVPTAFAQVIAADQNSFGNIMAGGLIATGGGLLYTTQGYSFIGQYKNGNSSVIDVTSTGAFTGGLQYVPTGFTGAGQLKMSSITGTWYTVGLNGTLGSYTVGSVTQYNPGIAAYSFDYMPADATFLTPKIVLGDANTQQLDAYGIDANGNPCPGCTPVVHLVTSDVGIGYGVARDPVTGDILFTTQSNDIWLVSDTAVVPEPGTVGLGLAGMAMMWWVRRRSRSATL
jgi:hypothetical protein